MVHTIGAESVITSLLIVESGPPPISHSRLRTYDIPWPGIWWFPSCIGGRPRTILWSLLDELNLNSQVRASKIDAADKKGRPSTWRADVEAQSRRPSRSCSVQRQRDALQIEARHTDPPCVALLSYSPEPAPAGREDNSI